MTSEPNNVEDTSVKIEIIPRAGILKPVIWLKLKMGESDDLKSETKALIDALKKRAQAEAQSAGTLTRETYISAVRRAGNN